MSSGRDSRKTTRFRHIICTSSSRTSCCRPSALVSRPSMLLRFSGCLALRSDPLSLAGGDGGAIGDAGPDEDATLSAWPRGLSMSGAVIRAMR